MTEIQTAQMASTDLTKCIGFHTTNNIAKKSRQDDLMKENPNKTVTMG